MMRVNLNLTNNVIQQILELSADAQIERRGTAKDSPAFHQLSGAIAAYGGALALLTAARKLEEFWATLDEPDLAEPVFAQTH